MFFGRFALFASIASASLGSAGCLPQFPELHESAASGDAGSNEPWPEGPDTQGDSGYELPPADPHALLGVDPPHGPFEGGTQAIVRGNGFSSKVRVWFGQNEVAASDVTPIDPTRVQVIVPKGTAGMVDVRAQNGDDASTSRVLPFGYSYDAFYADPASGPTSGGTVVTFYGQETSFGPGTKVSLGGKACGDVTVASATRLSCVTPKNTPGRKSASITTADDVTTTALDAFTYADSDNGFRGGLSGQKLDASLKVLALDAYSGDPIPGAVVIAGDNLESALRRTTDTSGVAFFQDAGLGPKRSVTIAAKCFQPVTFADVPVDTVTAYLTPIFSPACSSDDFPSVGGRPGLPARVRGEILWPFVAEFKRGTWSNVPQPIGNEERVAYLFTTSGNPAEDFRLPDPTLAIRPEAIGSQGFRFDVSTPVGNLALYALAGLEDRTVSPPRFTAYSMGALQGVSAQPGNVTNDVFLEMNVILDQGVAIGVSAPSPGPRGPDRIRATAAVEIGNNGFAIVPGMQKTTLLPLSGQLGFVGLPALTGALSTSRYVFTARAGTGNSISTPLSVVSSVATNDASRVVALDGFVQVPVLTLPEPNGAWDGRHLKVSFAGGGSPIDLIVYEISLGGGLVSWTVTTPGSVREVTLPDLASISKDLGIVPGPVSIRVSAARIVGFDYGQLQSKHLGRGGWNAYAVDESKAHL